MYRLGMVVAAFGGMYLLDRRMEGTKLHTILRRSGQESLGFYVIHLMIVYGSVINPGVNKLFADSLTPVEFIGVTAVVVAITYAVVMQWQKFRYSHPHRARMAIYALFAGFLLMFLAWPLFDPL